MRSANLIITGGIAAFSTFLATYASPVGTKELHHWALVLGMFTSIACISWLFFGALLLSKINNLKGQIFILLGYASALALCAISGSSFGALYFIMHAEKVDFITAFKSTAIVILGGYTIAAAIFGGALFYLKRQRSLPQSA
ncbi:hypothetical protein [Pseudomonas sp. EA_35y_Pfl2_R5]|uniref:hypothetical protein n=1 Tax=Pseudomonas sp. EA_35y_Pfl2_R5 TaxID=3088690 RepID=UPI0030D765FA